MMNINDLLASNFLNNASMTSPLGASQTSGQEAPLGAEGFQDLLALVGDMQVADEQSPQQGDLIKQSVQEMMSESPLARMELANLQMAPLVVNGPSIGLQPLAAEMPSPSRPQSREAVALDPLQTMELAQQSQLEISAKQRQPEAHDPAAVAEWSRAFMSNDLQKIEVGPDASTPQSASEGLDHRDSALTADMPFVPQAVETSSPVAAKSVAPKFAASSKPAERNAPGAEAFVAWSAQSSVAPAASERSAKALKSNTVKTEAVSGADFLLGQSVDARGVEGQAKAPAALVQSASLGESSDKRISAESLNFVADKIAALKDQGGGQIRVALNPNELGSVEIRVSINRQGTLDVKLLAERSSTMAALSEVKSELTTKLASIRPTKLDVGHLELGLSTRAEARTSAAFASSQDLMVSKAPSSVASLMREVPSSAPAMTGMKAPIDIGSPLSSVDFASAPRAEALSVKGSESAQTDGFSNAWNRDERRERARGQWEESFKERRSA